MLSSPIYTHTHTHTHILGHGTYSGTFLENTPVHTGSKDATSKGETTSKVSETIPSCYRSIEEAVTGQLYTASMAGP